MQESVTDQGLTRTESQGAAAHAAVDAQTPPPVFRTIVAGILMGLANLVPGISGGTMVLVVGVYDRFVGAIADLTRLRFRMYHIIFLGILIPSAGIAIVMLAGPVSTLVTTHRTAMYSLFIGLTLGGTPVLWKMLRPIRTSGVIGMVLGIAVMVGVRVVAPPKPELSQAEKAKVVLDANYDRDFAAGVLGMSAMVLPGISGAHMLLILGRYEIILAAIAQCKAYVASMGRQGDIATAMRIIIPVAIGSIISLVLFSNLIKWLLRRHPQPTVGFLLGILLGCVIAIWPFDTSSTSSEFMIGAVLAIVGLIVTVKLAGFSGGESKGRCTTA